MRSIVHVTHEAIQKVGGIGAVLQGLLTSKPYRNADQRTILIGPFFAGDPSASGRLGPDGEVLYSSADGITRHPVADALDHVRRDFHVNIVYGHRRIYDPASKTFVTPEIVLIDVSRMDLGRVNAFKGRLWHAYRLDSSRYEHSWEYDLYVKLAEPALAILHALGAADHGDECVVLAHEFMGLPTALAARLDQSGAFKTVFYAHEVSTMRRIVEEHPGHDVGFYNALSVAMENDRHVDDVFGQQDQYYRHALVKLSHYCDKIFAVGDYVAKELRFLGREFDEADIEITYNGIPAERITMDQKRESGRRMRDYAESLLGYRPDYIFTHVTRMSPSKGLWRDLRVLEGMEAGLRQAGKTAALIVLSTEVPARRPEDVRRMEGWWHWPMAHREADPDLSHGEALFYQGVQEFNLRGRSIKLIYVNQFGWDREACGDRMSADMSFMDIRRGSDVEFGQSIYEPFGIAPLEPLTYGGICVVSNVCGCAGFVEHCAGGQTSPNVIIADYCDIGDQRRDEASLLTIGREERDMYEARVAAQVAQRLLQTLPTDEASTAALVESGYQLARQMSWDVVAGEYVLPNIEHICSRLRAVRVA
jgi:hypothetical protein